MKRYPILLLLLPLALVALLSTACSPKNKTVKPNTRRVITTAKTVESVILNQPQFQTAQAKKARLSVDYQQRKVATSANISIYHDSIIIVSVQPMLGIELVRVEISKQQVLLLDKLNRRYCTLTYDQLRASSAIPVSYNDIEDLLTRHIFVIGESQQWLLNTQLEEQAYPDSHKLLFQKTKLKYEYQLDNSTHHILTTKLEHADPLITLIADYLNEQTYGEVVFPSVIRLGVSSTAIDLSCVVEMGPIEFNQPLNITAPSLQKMQQVDIKTILPM